MRLKHLTIPFIAFILLALPAAAQLNQSADARLERLERDLQTLQVQLFKQNPKKETRTRSFTTGRDLPKDTAERLQVQVADLEEEMLKLTGVYEETNHKLTQIQQRLDQLVADLDRRLLDLENGKRSTPKTSSFKQMPAPAAAETNAELTGENGSDLYAKNKNTLGTISKEDLEPAESVVLPDGTPQQKYDYAFEFLKKSDFENAETALKAFLAEFPSHELAGNAQYWLAETYFVRENYAQAAVDFLKGYQEYPNSSKVTDNLLKLALSLSKVGSIKESCTTLGKLAKEYPDSPSNIKRRGAAEWERLQCGQTNPQS